MPNFVAFFSCNASKKRSFPPWCSRFNHAYFCNMFINNLLDWYFKNGTSLAFTWIV